MIWCDKCKKCTSQPFIKDLTGSGRGYYQSTMGPGLRATIRKCKECGRKHHYTEET